jgi:hypothetical protein
LLVYLSRHSSKSDNWNDESSSEMCCEQDFEFEHQRPMVATKSSADIVKRNASFKISSKRR